MYKCNYCQFENEINQRFCQNCGHDLRLDQRTEVVADQQHNLKSQPVEDKNEARDEAIYQKSTSGYVVNKKRTVLSESRLLLIGVCIILIGGLIYYFVNKNNNNKSSYTSKPPVYDTTSYAANYSNEELPVVDTYKTYPREETNKPSDQPVPEEITQTELDNISNVLTKLYEAENDEKIDELLQYFAYPIKRYYTKYYLDEDAFTNIFYKSFDETLLYHKININLENSSAQKSGDRYYVLLKAMYNAITTKEPLETKKRDIQIVIWLNSNFKVEEMYEQ